MREKLYPSQHWKMAHRPCRAAPKRLERNIGTLAKRFMGPKIFTREYAATTTTRTPLTTRHLTPQRRPASALLGVLSSRLPPSVVGNVWEGHH